MKLARSIFHSLRHPTSLRATTTTATAINLQSPSLHSQTTNPKFLIPFRTFAISSAEEAAKERHPITPENLSDLSDIQEILHNRVQSLIRAGDLDNASAVTRHSLLFSTCPTMFTCNVLLGSMYRAKRYLDAIALFTYFFKQSNIVPDVVSYNFLIGSHCENGEIDKALEIYQHILRNAPFQPSKITFHHLTKGLINLGRIEEAEELLWQMMCRGYGSDSGVFNNIISGFLNMDNLEKAIGYFDELKLRSKYYDGIINATFMEWFFSKGKPREAMKSYHSWLEKKFEMVPETCNVLLEVLLKWDKKKDAEALFQNMLNRHNPSFLKYTVNSDTFNIMVNERFKRGKGSEAYSIFKKVGNAPQSYPFAMDMDGYNNIIKRYCENDMIDDAEKMYLELCRMRLLLDVKMYNTLIDAYFKAGRIDEAVKKYTKMVESGLRVITINANKWFLNMIEHGRIMECGPILTKMAESDPKPDATTYDMVIRACCGVSNFDMSLFLLQEMVSNGVGLPLFLRSMC